jgi:hypothetical protein
VAVQAVLCTAVERVATERVQRRRQCFDSCAQVANYDAFVRAVSLCISRSFHDGGQDGGPHIVPVADFLNHSCNDANLQPVLEADGFNVRACCCTLHGACVSIGWAVMTRCRCGRVGTLQEEKSCALVTAR